MATLVTGLRADSRLKMKISGMRVPLNTMLLSLIYDKMSMKFWSESEDGRRKRNRPQSITKLLTENPEPKPKAFVSGEAFMAARKKIVERSGKG